MKYIKNRLLRLFLFIIIGFLSGCWLEQHDIAGDGSDPAKLLLNGAYGTRTLRESSTTWITNPTTLKQVYAALNKHQTGNEEEPPDINFETDAVLLLEMGQKPTGGYSIDFVPSLSRKVDTRAVIHVSWNTPKKGAVLTQVVTSPFMLLKIRRSGITSITIIDQNERPLFDIAIK